MLIAVARIRTYVDPVANLPWQGVEESPQNFLTLVKSNFTRQRFHVRDTASRGEKHAAQIARFMNDGWDDPVQIDVGVPSMGQTSNWIIEDGNHRLYAAIALNQQYINVQLSGCVRTLENMFGNARQDMSISFDEALDNE